MSSSPRCSSIAFVSRRREPILRRPTEGEDIAADYRHLGVSLGRHPLTLLRRALAAAGIRSAREVARIGRRGAGPSRGARHYSAAAGERGGRDVRDSRGRDGLFESRRVGAACAAS